MKKLALVGALLAATTFVRASGAQAQVAFGQETFDFQGQCSDCTGFGTAILTVQDYTPGTALQDSNLIDFTYASNLTSVDINPVDDGPLYLDSLSGSITSSRGYYDVSVTQSFFGKSTVSEFDSYPDGTWAVSNIPEGFTDLKALDNGTNGTWNEGTVSAAPEPSTWLLMIAGIGGIGLMLRRAKSIGFRFKDAFSA